jgi:hypothetical protein
VVVSVAGTLGRARATDASDPSATFRTTALEIELDYHAPRDCPGVEAYLADVKLRLGPHWKAALKDLAEHLTVTVARTGDRYGGALEFVTVRGERFSRSVSGAVCAEVVRGIGLITALAVNARAGGSAVRTDTSTTTSADPARPARAPSLPREGRSGSAAVEESRTATVPSTRSRTNVQVRFGARASLTSGVGPGVTLGPGAFAIFGLARARLGVGADLFDSGTVRARAIRADFRLLSARLEGCPWSFGLGRWGTLEPCATGELGSFRAAPELDPPVVTVSTPKSIAWGAAGVLGRLVLHFPPFVAAVEVIGRTPLRRERFFVGSRDDVIFEIPVASAGASVGLGLEF